MARKRKALAVKNSDAGPGEEEAAAAAAAAEEERMAEMFKAIDQQVQSRAAAIRAIRDAQIAEFLAQIKLQQSCLSEETLDMPIARFLELYSPNTDLVCKESGVVELRKKAAPPLLKPASLPMAVPIPMPMTMPVPVPVPATASVLKTAAAADRSSPATFFCTPRAFSGAVVSSSMRTRSMR